MTNKADTQELLPCPFCGGTDTLWVDNGLCEDGNWTVWCEGGCKASGAFKSTSKAARAEWNTRADSQPVAAGADCPHLHQDHASRLMNRCLDCGTFVVVAARPDVQPDDARVERLQAQLDGVMNCLAITQQEVERLRACPDVWEQAILTIKAEIDRCAEFGVWPSFEDFKLALEAARDAQEGREL